MRILFLSHRFPYPPTFGSKVRAFNTIKHLARQHEVSVLSLVRSDDEAAEAAGIAPYCAEYRALRVHDAVQAAKIVATLPTPLSASEAFFDSASMRREIQRQVDRRSYDFVFAHCSAVGRYIEHLDGLPRLIDYCDVDSRKWRDYVDFKPWPLSQGYRWEAWRMERAERRIAAAVEQVTVATPGEVHALAEVGVHNRVDWFANGVDLEYFRPEGAGYDESVITFVGRMDYFPNEQCMVDFCATVWPLLRRERPRLQLQIVGAAPTRRVLALAGIAGVKVTGAVPDVRPYLRRSALTITPLKIARGTQNKILESMALGVPVVSSSVAARGVDAVPGEHLLVADSPQEVTAAVLRLLADPVERRRLAEAGRARVASHHGWSGALGRLDGIMARCLAGAGARRAEPAAA